MILPDCETVRTLLASLSTDAADPLNVLRILTTQEYLSAHSDCTEDAIESFLLNNQHHSYFSHYGISPFTTDNSAQAAKAFISLRKVVPNFESGKLLLNTLFPYLFKTDYLFSMDAPPLTCYTLTCILVQFSRSCNDSDLINGNYLVTNFYAPNSQIFQELGICDFGSFFDCWGSLHYYRIRLRDMHVPSIIRSAMELYRKHNIPYTVLFSQYAYLKTSKKSISSAFNPWEQWRKNTQKPQIESGITLEEHLFNECVLSIRKQKPTDVVNALFYQHRNDSILETNILLNALLLNVCLHENILIINPSPDFLIAFHKTDLLVNNIVFAVADQLIADVYAEQFDYRFVSLANLTSIDDRFDNIVICARDTAPEMYTTAFDLGKPQVRILAFLPQTAITSRNANVIRALESKNLYVSSILSLPRELTGSRRSKKMLLHAERANTSPTTFDLLHTTCCSLDPDHYVTVDRTIRRANYETLFKHRTLKQISDYYDKMQSEASGSNSRRKNSTADIYSFSKEIAIPYNIYPHASGSLFARGCFRSIVPESNSRMYGTLLIPYFSTGAQNSPEGIVSRLKEITLTNTEYAETIASEIERFYSSCPETLTLKTVWYCNRRYLLEQCKYDDSLAIEMFCSERQDLSDLVIGQATAETVSDALNATLPEPKCSQSKYHRLLYSIFQIAKERGYLPSNPLPVKMTSYTNDMEQAMKALRAALKKDFLSHEELKLILNFLFEPMGRQQTPRVVQDSSWLIAFIRLCTGMPLREICALNWRHFHKIGGHNAWQFYIIQMLSDTGTIIPIRTYSYIQQYRKFPCVSLLSHILLLRREYLKTKYGFSDKEIPGLPIAFSEEPGTRRKGRKKSFAYCTVRQARKICREVLAQAKIPSNVITLLDGEDSFIEDLNSCQNDLYYSNFLHHAISHCGLNDGEVCYLVGRKAATTFSKNYADFSNDYLQLDIILRLNRLWAVVSNCSQKHVRNKYQSIICHERLALSAPAAGDGLTAVDLCLTPCAGSTAGQILVRIDCEHGVNGSVTAFSEEEVAE